MIEIEADAGWWAYEPEWTAFAAAEPTQTELAEAPTLILEPQDILTSKQSTAEQKKRGLTHERVGRYAGIVVLALLSAGAGVSFMIEHAVPRKATIPEIRDKFNGILQPELARFGNLVLSGILPPENPPKDPKVPGGVIIKRVVGDSSRVYEIDAHIKDHRAYSFYLQVDSCRIPGCKDPAQTQINVWEGRLVQSNSATQTRQNDGVIFEASYDHYPKVSGSEDKHVDTYVHNFYNLAEVSKKEGNAALIGRKLARFGQQIRALEIKQAAGKLGR